MMLPSFWSLISLNRARFFLCSPSRIVFLDDLLPHGRIFEYTTWIKIHPKYTVQVPTEKGRHAGYLPHQQCPKLFAAMNVLDPSMPWRGKDASLRLEITTFECVGLSRHDISPTRSQCARRFDMNQATPIFPSKYLLIYPHIWVAYSCQCSIISVCHGCWSHPIYSYLTYLTYVICVPSVLPPRLTLWLEGNKHGHRVVIIPVCRNNETSKAASKLATVSQPWDWFLSINQLVYRKKTPGNHYKWRKNKPLKPGSFPGSPNPMSLAIFVGHWQRWDHPDCCACGGSKSSAWEVWGREETSSDVIHWLFNRA